MKMSSVPIVIGLLLAGLTGCQFVEPDVIEKTVVIPMHTDVAGKCFYGMSHTYRLYNTTFYIDEVTSTGYDLAVISKYCDIKDRHKCVYSPDYIGWIRADTLHAEYNIDFTTPADCHTEGKPLNK